MPTKLLARIGKKDLRYEMGNLDARPSRAEKTLLRRIEKNALEFYELNGGPIINAVSVGENLDEMTTYIEKARLNNNPAVILSAEARILTVDLMKLEQFVDKEIKQGNEVSPEIKADLTSLDDGIRQIDRATRVFVLRAQYGEDAYQDISAGSRSEKDVDKHGTANDVLLQSCKSHGTRLQNMARGVSKTEMDRKAQFAIGKRRENMAACESLYKAHQIDYVKNRESGRGLA